MQGSVHSSDRALVCPDYRAAGGVVGEPVYNKVEDFAMEFYSDGKGRIIFAGYSLFRTNAGGAYEGNRLLPDAEIERRLSAYVPVAALHRLREELQDGCPSLWGRSIPVIWE